jgi:endonuclease/exonuclease/phosphatase family metal-dependent hydrolase
MGGSTQSLIAISYNIRLDTHSDGDLRWSQRRDQLVRLLRFHRPDLIAVQEALPHQLRELLHGLGGYGYIGEGREGGRSGEHSALVYRRDRLVPLTAETYWLSEEPDTRGSRGWGAKHPRIATEARFSDTVTKQRFLAVCTHLDHRSDRARTESTRLILERSVAPAQDQGVPVLVAGDCNGEPQERFYGLFTERLHDPGTGESHLRHGPHQTLAGDHFHIGSAERRRIDYIFISSEVEPIRFGTLSDNIDGLCPSDHFPLLLEFEL